MAEVLFYEKPGCVNNSRQKAWLRASGHRVIERNLLTEPWTAGRLRGFFGSLPVRDWFNPTAPRLARGDVDPKALGDEEALALMVRDPILIRRPLLEVGAERRAGFDPARVRTWIGLNEQENGDLETCPHPGVTCGKGE